MLTVPAPPAKPSRVNAHPPWVGALQRLVAVALGADPSTRFIAGLPTVELTAAVSCMSAVEAQIRTLQTTALNRPERADLGAWVSVSTGGEYIDARLDAVGQDYVRVGQSTFTKNLDAVRVIPHELVELRDRRVLRPAIEDAWRSLSPTDGYRLHAKVSARPIVVIGSLVALRSELDVLAPLWPKAPFVLDLGCTFDQWFRHPALVISPQAEIVPWVAALDPALVIIVGAAGWRSTARRALSHAPQVWLLDRKSPAAVEAIDELLLSQPAALPVKEAFAGIEVYAFEEAAVVGNAADDEDEY